MRNVYWFNPENDLAIANGAENYYPPPSARAIAADLSLLPIWYAPSDSMVVTPLSIPETWNESVREQLAVSAKWAHPNTLSIEPTDRLTPWGWSAAIAKQFKRLGAATHQYPSKKELELLRDISHKGTSIVILEQLGRIHPHFLLPQLPVLLTSAAQVKQYIEQGHPVLLKAPWSNSGKGILWERDGYDIHTQRWSDGILKHQGTLIGEQVYPKVADCAMEFYSNGEDRVSFAGYSWFETDTKGVYQGNVLLSDTEIERRIVNLLPNYPLESLKRALEQILSNLVGSLYSGYLGIDMLIWQEGCDQYRLHPCVELNLRHNMGIVSRLLYDRYVAVGGQGRYFVHYSKTPQELASFCAELAESNPLAIRNGRIQKGYLSLTPVLESTTYHAGIVIT